MNSDGEGWALGGSEGNWKTDFELTAGLIQREKGKLLMQKQEEMS